jgi:hypothetical protein
VRFNYGRQNRTVSILQRFCSSSDDLMEYEVKFLIKGIYDGRSVWGREHLMVVAGKNLGGDKR